MREREDKKRVSERYQLADGLHAYVFLVIIIIVIFLFSLSFFVVELKTRKVHSRKIKIFPTLNLDLLDDLGSGGEISK